MSTSDNKVSFLAEDKGVVFLYEVKDGKVLAKKRWANVRRIWIGMLNGTTSRTDFHAETLSATRAALAALDAQASKPLISASSHPLLSAKVPLSGKQKNSNRQWALTQSLRGRKESEEEKAIRIEISNCNKIINRKSTLPKTRAAKIARLKELGEVPW
ncbi:uncharacterized protein JCM6883_005132 [Sporobolomyces salmoneus]|uniref:uncharacterized protein n=1 Tax=Sporobolomyces salmoneus TaxID=183962 RepID=UPI00317FDB22